MIIIDMEMPKTCNECPCSYFTEGASSDYCQVEHKDFDEETEGKTYYGMSNGVYTRQKWCPLKEKPKEKHEKVTCITCRHLRTELIQRRNIPDGICAAPIWKELNRTVPHVIGHDLHEPIRCDHWEPKEEGNA